MSSSIADIRELIEDPDSDLTGLLSRAALLATLLKQKTVLAWMKQELNGYQEGDVLPEYRQGACGTLVAWFPGQGWAEAPIERAHTDENLLCYALYEPLPNIETAFNENAKSGGQRIDFTPEKLEALQEQTQLSTRLALAVPSQSFALATLGGRQVLQMWADKLVSLDLPQEASRFSREDIARAAPANDEFQAMIPDATEAARALTATLKPKRKGFLGRMLGIS